MNSTAIATKNGNGHVAVQSPDQIMENVVIKGDLSKLTPEQRGAYYMTVCKSVGLNPLTKPFEYITLNGKLTLYALRNCTDQLRTIHNVSVVELVETERDGVFIVTAKVANGNGRTDIAKGAVNISALKGENLANAMMKAETKAKRRATLSLCGLGFLDETEVEDIPAPVKTLPKSHSRPVYAQLQKEIDEATSHEVLKQWGIDAKQRIEVMPSDWQDILRLRYQEKLVMLRQHPTQAETTPKAAPRDLEPGESIDAATGEVIWSEPDAGDMPEFLDRSKTPKADKAETEWLRELAGALSGCEDAISMGEKIRDVMLPMKGKCSASSWSQAQALAEDTLRRVQAP